MTLPSPQLTARIFPATLQDTRQTASGNFPDAVAALGDVVDAEGSNTVLTHGAVGESLVQMSTDLSFRDIVKLDAKICMGVDLPERLWQYSS